MKAYCKLMRRYSLKRNKGLPPVAQVCERIFIRKTKFNSTESKTSSSIDGSSQLNKNVSNDSMSEQANDKSFKRFFSNSLNFYSVDKVFNEHRLGLLARQFSAFSCWLSLQVPSVCSNAAPPPKATCFRFL